MKKRIALFFAVLAAVLAMTALFSIGVSAEGEKLTVVYLRDGGKGDGKTPATAVGFIEDAYAALDLSKDCTVVICGKYTQEFAFSHGESYTGSVTITSCYGGYDYRKAGAEYAFRPCRFVCWGETTFRNITFNSLSTNILIIGQHNPVTLAEGCEMTGSSEMTGGSIAKAFAIVGGYQKGQDDPPTTSDRDTNITVMSGSKIYIVAFSREIPGQYMGTAHVKIGGTADVTVLNCTSAYPTGIQLGDLEVELTDKAKIKNVYGCTQETFVNSVKFTWKSGSIDVFEWNCSYTPKADFQVGDKTTLLASPKVKTSENYTSVAAQFDVVGDAQQDPTYVAPSNPDTKKPTEDMLTPPDDGTSDTTDKTPESNKPASTSKPSGSSTGKAEQTTATQTGAVTSASDGQDGGSFDTTTVIIIAAAAAVVVGVVVAIVIISKKKQK